MCSDSTSTESGTFISLSRDMDCTKSNLWWLTFGSWVPHFVPRRCTESGHLLELNIVGVPCHCVQKLTKKVFI